jgi:hypothetical protein
MVQYPDTIVITVNVPATQGSDGNWITGSSTTYTFSCRAETNSSGRKITGDDGVLVDYNYICYLQQMSTVIPRESSYTLTKLNGGIFSGTIKNQSNGQLNSRLWL